MSAVSPTDNNLQGVKGWLKFFVIMRIYIAPILLAIGVIYTWVIAFMIAADYPFFFIPVIVNTGVSIFIALWGIKIGKNLRDVKPQAVQDTKRYLIAMLIIAVVLPVVSFVSGLPADAILLDWIKGIFKAAIGFGIWFTYFNVSRRVKATYLDA